MRAFRATVVALLSAVLLGGCGLARPDDPAPGPSAGDGLTTLSAPARGDTATDDPSASGDPSPTGPSATGAPDPSGSAAHSPDPGPSPAPSSAQLLVWVTRSGGFAGRTHTLAVTGDGSWTRLDAHAKPEGTGRLSAAQLGRLRTAVEDAGFARLPRTVKSGGTVFDGFTYTFVHGAFRVVTDDGSVPPALTKVLDALPPFEGN